MYTSEPEAVRAIFRDVFGWKHVDNGHGWLIFALPPAELGIHPGEGPTYDRGVRHQLSLMCDDLTTTVAELRSKRLDVTRASIEAAGSGYQLFSVIPDTLTARVLVTGDLAAGALLRLHVADTRRAAAYRASVAQAASRDTFAQQPLAGYALRVVPPASE